MKRASISKKLLHRAFNIAPVLLLLPVIVLYSFRSGLKQYADWWEQLGITEQVGSERIRESFITGYLQYYGLKNLKSIAASDRKSITMDLLTYSKKYVSSEEFQKVYERKRLGMKPREVTRKPKTEDQIRQEQIATAKKGMTSMENALKTATPDLKKAYQDSYDMYKKHLEDYQKPDNEMVRMMAKGEQTKYEAELKRFEDRLKKWETEYPAESSGFIKLRLQKVLEATEGIDYNAELTERNDKKYFVKQEYEKKDQNWKAGFRAGKEVTETVRAFVKQWVTEL